jgi:very-short-patch-repair endonuclease
VRRLPKDTTLFAREMRNAPTPAEYRLWKAISRYRPKFVRQHQVRRFLIDLACRQLKIGVEIDGSQHANAMYDKRRTTILNHEGWTIIRFWNNEVLMNTDGVVRIILDRAAEQLGGSHPQPIPSREGRVRKPRFK